MKTTQKILSLIFVLALALALAVPAVYAGEDTGAMNKYELVSYGEWDTKDGTLSAEIGEGVTWLCGTEGGETQWYGIENEDGRFAPGSRLNIRWETLDTTDDKPSAKDAGHYKVWVSTKETDEQIIDAAKVFVQLGSSPAEEGSNAFSTPDGKSVEPESVKNLQSPEGVAPFAEVSVPEEGLFYSREYFNEITIGDISGELSGGKGTLPGSFFSQGNWAVIIALVEFGVIVGLVVGFTYRKKAK